MRRTQSARLPGRKRGDADYEIVTYTGETTFKAPVTVKIRGDTGTISIPLTKTKKDESPFQSNAIDEFTCRTTDVGKIKRITIEHTGTNEEEIWHLKKIKIKKGNDVYHFHTDVHLGFKENKANFYPVGALLGHKREDYVQTELRRLRESLRTESYKMHRPPHKAYEPFVYNDLSPYFDTTPVEKAIYAPLETPPGYYTRLTALRIVEPWEGYGMDYGVNYELLKQRKIRSSSSKRAKTVSQTGMMILPPMRLPYGGQVTYVNPAKMDRAIQEASRASRHRPLVRQNDDQVKSTATAEIVS